MDQCPACSITLDPNNPEAGAAHVANCIENQIFHAEDNKRKLVMISSTKGAQLFPVQGHQGNLGISSSNAPMDAKPEIHQDDEQNQCPICHTSLLSKAVGDSPSAREAHITACLNALSSQPAGSVSKANDLAPPYRNFLSAKGVLPNLAPPYRNSPSAKGALAQASANSLGFFSSAATSLSQVSDDRKAMGNSNGQLMRGQEDRMELPIPHTTS